MGLILPLTRLLSALPPVFWPLPFSPSSFLPGHLEDELTLCWFLAATYHQGQFPTTTSAPLRVVITTSTTIHESLQPFPSHTLKPRSQRIQSSTAISKVSQDMGLVGVLVTPPCSFSTKRQIPDFHTNHNRNHSWTTEHSLVPTQNQTMPNITNCKLKPQHGPADRVLLKGSLRVQQFHGKGQIFGMPGSHGYRGNGNWSQTVPTCPDFISLERNKICHR